MKRLFTFNASLPRDRRSESGSDRTYGKEFTKKRFIGNKIRYHRGTAARKLRMV